MFGEESLCMYCTDDRRFPPLIRFSTMPFAGLPRALTLFRLPRKECTSEFCIRNTILIITFQRPLHISSAFHKFVPPILPDLSNSSGVDLNEFLGPPGWQLDDLLPPSRRTPSSSERTEGNSITPETLHHLLRLSGLPPPESANEESDLLSALHDQLHFVRHVQSVPTTDVKPLIRVGNEAVSDGGNVGPLSYEECVEEGKVEDIPGLEWKEWDVCALIGGSREDREYGWFVVQGDQLSDEEEECEEEHDEDKTA
jgi:hypothetical protein